jgi:hypothetical protein
MVMMVMVVVAAVPRARAIIAAAGVLRAALVVDAEEGILADTLVAGSTLIAIPVVAALSAGASLRIPVLTADEPVAAIELVAAVATGSADCQETAEVSHALAALIFRDALMSAAAGFAEQTEERMTSAILPADLAIGAILIATALGIGALADLVADRTAETVMVGAALGAIGPFFSLTAAGLAVRAFRHVGAGVLAALDTRAEVRRRADAIAIGAALAALDPGAIAADAVVQIGAESAFAFLTVGAGADARATIANLARAAGVDARTAIARLAGAAGADALAGTVVALQAEALITTALVRAEPPCIGDFTGGSGTRVGQDAIRRGLAGRLRPRLIETGRRDGKATDETAK